MFCRFVKFTYFIVFRSFNRTENCLVVKEVKTRDLYLFESLISWYGLIPACSPFAVRFCRESNLFLTLCIFKLDCNLTIFYSPMQAMMNSKYFIWNTCIHSWINQPIHKYFVISYFALAWFLTALIAASTAAWSPR